MKKEPAKPAPRGTSPRGKAPAKPSDKALVPARRTAAPPARRPSAPPPAKANDLMARAMADAGVGMEGADGDTFAIPFIRVVQALSPQVTAGKPSYNPDAVPGMLVNTVTNELIPGEDGIVFVPCAFKRRFIQWGPRGTDRAGFKGEWLPEDVAAKLQSGELTKSEEDGKIYIGEPNPKKSDRLEDTRTHYGLVLTDNGPVQVILALKGSQVKKSKQLMGILSALRLNGKTPPTFMSKIRVTVPQEQESNADGSWFGVRVEHAGYLLDDGQDGAEIYDQARTFHNLVIEGKARVNYDGLGDEDYAGNSDGDDSI